MGKSSTIAAATRASIGNLFPMGPIMSSGSNNPITIHSVDDDLFRCIWALIAETMCVSGELNRSTKEAICEVVSEHNRCPVCLKAHSMMNVVATQVEMGEKGLSQENKNDIKQKHDQALAYAGILLEEMDKCNENEDADSKGTSAGKTTTYSHLNDAAKAEVALVVLLFDHMNRVVSVVMGEEMSTAMFSVPRFFAKPMEKPGTIRTMSKWMTPLLSGTFKVKNQPGVTVDLFPEERAAKKPLPAHLQGVVLAGSERAKAVSNLLDWAESFEEATIFTDRIASKTVIELLELAIKKAPSRCAISKNQETSSPSKQIVTWVEECVKNDEAVSTELKKLSDSDTGKALFVILMLTSLAPQAAYRCSPYWSEVTKSVGSDLARSIVMWWSLRCTMHQAKGF